MNFYVFCETFNIILHIDLMTTAEFDFESFAHINYSGNYSKKYCDKYGNTFISMADNPTSVSRIGLGLGT